MTKPDNVVYLRSKLTPWRIARATRAALLPLQLCSAGWQLYWRLWAQAWRYPDAGSNHDHHDHRDGAAQ